MKHIIITILFLNITPILPEEIIRLRAKNNIAYIYEEPNLKSKKISKIKENLEFSQESLKIKVEQTPIDFGYWIQLRKPNGWIFTKEIIFDIENDDYCNDSLKIPSKLFLEGFEVIILKDGLFLISSNELGSSFNQQVGVWKSDKGNFEGIIYFEDSTITDCLNICYENEDTSNCKKSCEKEAKKEFGILSITAKIDFLLKIKQREKILFFKTIKDIPKRLKSFFQNIHIEENRIYKTECIAN
ncbi:hypothetical protein P3G55_18145 [Leptospira sp. 96542]|nr:hypothetical protein [Leptospira sp. 96542]